MMHKCCFYYLVFVIKSLYVKKIYVTIFNAPRNICNKLKCTVPNTKIDQMESVKKCYYIAPFIFNLCSPCILILYIFASLQYFVATISGSLPLSIDAIHCMV